MNFTQQFMPLAPVMIVSLTSVVVMILIAIKRHHALVSTVTALGLNLSGLYIILTMFGGHFKPSDVMGMFVVDPFTMLYQLLIVVVSLACCTLSHHFIKHYENNKEELYLLLLLSVAGAMLMVASAHYASFFISLELMSVPVYGLLAYTHEREKSLESGLKYLVLSATASAMLLMGIAYIYAYTGTLSFYNGFEQLLKAIQAGNPVVVLGIAMVLFAMAFKLSLAPFHKWTPDVYEGAPTPLAAFLASAAKVATIGLLVRYSLAAGVLIPSVTVVLTVIAVLSILAGNLLALRQDHLKRVLAYSSIAHFGYLLIALVSKNYFSIDAINFYTIVYALTTVGAFGVVSVMGSDYRGLYWKNPVLASVLTVMMLSLAGIPLTGGFIAKFMVIKAAVDAGHWYLAAAVIVGSGLGLYYYLRVTIALYVKPNVLQTKKAPFGVTVMLVFTMLAILLMGVYPDPFIKISTVSQLLAPIQIALFGH